MEFKQTEAQRRADKNYREKNKGKARLPGGFLNDVTAQQIEWLAVIKGTKMAAITEAIDLLYKQEN